MAVVPEDGRFPRLVPASRPPDMLSSVFLASLLSGLLLGVYAMLTGVERTPAAAGTPAARAHAARTRAARTPAAASQTAGAVPPPPPPAHTRVSPPTVAASATLFGLVGYLMLRYTSVGAPVVIVAAAIAAGLGMVGMLTLVTRWAIPAAAADPLDPRYLLQGTPGRITRAVGADSDGEVEYEVDGARYATVARSFDGTPLDVGAEVALDRIEDGVAYVEDWALVEQRL